ncbi:MAG: phosphoribosylamine--glycine ligase [Candidatus Peribacteraceae bacterium]|nr:phosphoribosylamine--glycine ligase [Candidatus Peribacteraceae bacterium]
MKVLLIAGTTAREHAIADALSRSRHKPEIIALCASPNPGIRAVAARQEVMNIMDFPRVLDIAKEVKPDFAIIGPDDPIGSGLADELEAIGVPCVAPKKSLARIESSKGFTRDLLAKFGIDASPKFRVFSRTGNSIGALAEEKKSLHAYLTELGGDFVVKYDALKGGKGVKLSGEHLATIEDGVDYAIECLNECGRTVIEEKLVGVEFSLLSFVSGTQVADMPAVQDHKRAHERDLGANTGGMGTYTDADHSLPFLAPADLEKAKEINRQVAAALMEECGEAYKGILYGGFIAVKDGIRVIEYNARFGDPEALNLLPLLRSDFVDICLAIIRGELRDDLVSFANKATVCKYVTAQSYPESKKEKGQPFTLPSPLPSDVRLFYGDATEGPDGTLLLGGSRAVGIVGIGDTIELAERAAQSVCEQIRGPVRYRRDIGTKKLIGQRIEMMKQLRS